ncbi:MAG: hypothetical protein WBV39_01750 [Rudaea sp.]
MTIRKNGLRTLTFALLALAGMTMTSAVFARSHFSVGVNLPGVSLGYYGGSHWHNRGYVAIGYGGYVGGYDGPAYYDGYYAPAPVYYDDYYYDYAPVVYTGYYSRPYYYGHGYYSGYRGGYGGHGHYYRGGHGYYHGNYSHGSSHHGHSSHRGSYYSHGDSHRGRH